MKYKERFNCTDGERAAFEAGIKLGSLFHQYMGSPLSGSNVEAVEKAMEEGMMTQPYVVAASVRVDREQMRRHRSEYGYCSLNERMISAEITVRYRDVEAKASLSWVEELKYALMRIDGIQSITPP